MRVVALVALVACGSPQPPELDCTLEYPGLPITSVDSVSIVRMADMNRDGHVDVVVATPLRVLLGDGSGNFRALDPVPNLEVSSLLVADFNDDGILDAFTIDSSSRNRVFFGTGTGDFASSLETADGFGVSSNLITADLDGDGHQDIADFVGNQIAVAWGRGDGSLAVPAGTTLVGSPNTFAVADIDGDGRRDFVVLEGTSIRVYTNQGARTFLGGAQIVSGLKPQGEFTVDDVDGDGYPDVIVSDGDATAVLPNVGGAFGPVAVRLDRGGRPQIADMDGDQRRDIVISEFLSAATTVYRNVGALTFAAGATSPIRGELVDIDGDGDVDVVTKLIFGIAVSLNRGDGTFVAPTTRATSVQTLAIAAGDLDGDGAVDLVTGANDVLLANGQANLASTVAPATSRTIALADLDGDSALDLVESVESGIRVMHGRGDGRFAEHAFTTLDSPSQLVLADLDGDGISDIAAAYETQGQSQGTSVLLGRGDGSFGPRIDFATGSSQSIAVGDLDGDGRLDLVVGTTDLSDPSVVVLTNRGAGRFEETWRRRVAERMRVATADLDRDGGLDLVLFGASSVSIVRGARFPRRFSEPVSYPLGLTVADGAVVDLDGDGWIDVVASLQGNSNGSPVAIVRNDHGTLREPRLFLAGVSPQGLVVADLDGDGMLDIATADAYDHNVMVLPARCSSAR